MEVLHKMQLGAEDTWAWSWIAAIIARFITLIYLREEDSCLLCNNFDFGTDL